MCSAKYGGSFCVDKVKHAGFKMLVFFYEDGWNQLSFL